MSYFQSPGVALRIHSMICYRESREIFDLICKTNKKVSVSDASSAFSKLLLKSEKDREFLFEKLSEINHSLEVSIECLRLDKGVSSIDELAEYNMENYIYCLNVFSIIDCICFDLGQDVLGELYEVNAVCNRLASELVRVINLCYKNKYGSNLIVCDGKFPYKAVVREGSSVKERVALLKDKQKASNGKS